MRNEHLRGTKTQRVGRGNAERMRKNSHLHSNSFKMVYKWENILGAEGT